MATTSEPKVDSEFIGRSLSSKASVGVIKGVWFGSVLALSQSVGASAEWERRGRRAAGGRGAGGAWWAPVLHGRGDGSSGGRSSRNVRAMRSRPERQPLQRALSAVHSHPPHPPPRCAHMLSCAYLAPPAPLHPTLAYPPTTRRLCMAIPRR